MEAWIVGVLIYLLCPSFLVLIWGISSGSTFTRRKNRKALSAEETLQSLTRERRNARYRLESGWDVEFYRLLQAALPAGVCPCRHSDHTSTGLVHAGNCPIHARSPEEAATLKTIDLIIESNRKNEELRTAQQERAAELPRREYIVEPTLCEPEPRYYPTTRREGEAPIQTSAKGRPLYEDAITGGDVVELSLWEAAKRRSHGV